MRGNMYEGLLKKIKELKKDEPFLVTLTVFNKKGIRGRELETYLFVNGFPFEEFEGTKLEIIRLIDQAK